MIKLSQLTYTSIEFWKSQKIWELKEWIEVLVEEEKGEE